MNSAYPTTNYGGLSNLYVGNGGTALIQFDLSSLPAGTTAAQIGKATLKLYVNRINVSGLVSVLPVTSAWRESAVTYATIPTLGAAVATFTPTATQQFIVIDITSLVQGWVTTPASNYGIALTSTAGSIVFDSKENDETSHVAHLEIHSGDVDRVGARPCSTVARVCADQKDGQALVAGEVQGKRARGARCTGGSLGGGGSFRILPREDRGQEIARDDGVVARHRVRHDCKKQDQHQSDSDQGILAGLRPHRPQCADFGGEPGIDDSEHPDEHDHDVDEEKGQQDFGLDYVAENSAGAP